MVSEDVYYIHRVGVAWETCVSVIPWNHAPNVSSHYRACWLGISSARDVPRVGWLCVRCNAGRVVVAGCGVFPNGGFRNAMRDGMMRRWDCTRGCALFCDASPCVAPCAGARVLSAASSANLTLRGDA